jgi:hypothetical protein
VSQTSSPKMWDVATNLSLDRLAGWCLLHRQVNRVMVVCRMDTSTDSPSVLSPDAEAVALQLLGDKLLRTTVAVAWPGTKLFGHGARVHIGVFDEEVLLKMAATENILSRWVHWNAKPLPEDICLWRVGDIVPTLISVTHDGDAWLLAEGPVPGTVASPSEFPLPADLIPPPPDFLLE